jgi:hypothetical protein
MRRRRSYGRRRISRGKRRFIRPGRKRATYRQRIGFRL